MTDTTPSRGPDFLPYPLPARPVAQVLASAPSAPTASRWQRALDGVTPWGVAAITAGIAAGLSLVIVSLLAGNRPVGAILASLAAVLSVGAAWKALKQEQPDDSRSLVKGGSGIGVVAALIAVLLLLTHRSSIAEQPPVQVPSPAPSSTSEPQPTPSPSPGTPRPSPTLGVLPPGSNDLFGVPTQPDAPVTQTSTAQGLLTGRVVTQSGRPLPGALVTVTRADPADTSDSPGCPLRVTAKTGADGRYLLQLCQLGDNLGYHVVISSGTAKASTDLYVNAGQITVYNVILALRHA